MRAAVMKEFGGPDVLAVEDVEKPRPGVGEVLVRVRASSVNPVDALIRAGAANPGLKTPAIIGSDIAGIIEEVGDGVTELQAGDEVFYTAELADGGGAHAEYHVAAATIVAPKPTSLNFTESAAIPLAGGTAWEAIVRRLAVRPGETVLVHGGSGGVGSFAIQFAAAAGALVLSTAGPDNQDLVRDLGAIPIDYTSEDFVDVCRDRTAGAGVDAVLDTIGGENVARSLAAARDWGRVATVLAPDTSLDDLYQRNQSLYGIFLTRERRRLTEMTPVFEHALARPCVERVLDLDEVAEAHRQLDSHHARGKTVLEIA